MTDLETTHLKILLSVYKLQPKSDSISKSTKMCSLKSFESLMYLSVLLVLMSSVTASKHWGKPEHQEVEPVEQQEAEDNGSPVKTCEMVCRMKPRSGRKDWKQESFWTILSAYYTCRWQELGRKLRENVQFADIVIDFTDVDTKMNKTRFAHSSILSYVSDKLRQDVERAITDHVSNYTRPRERLPSLRWPPLPTEAVDALLEYIYTNRMTKFDPSSNIIALYVAAFTADHKEMMKIIETYLDDALYTVEQLNQLVLYLRYAHRNNLLQLKDVLTVIARKILKMTEPEFEVFIRDICESSGYTRSWQNLPGGQIRPGEIIPEDTIPTRPPTTFGETGIAGGVSGVMSGTRTGSDVRGTGSSIVDGGIGGRSTTGGITGGGGTFGSGARDGGLGLSSSDIRPNIGRSSNLIQENKERLKNEHNSRSLPPYEDHP